jgi:hypothetical protein
MSALSDTEGPTSSTRRLGASPNETLQVGIVVRDLDETMRRYIDDY